MLTKKGGVCNQLILDVRIPSEVLLELATCKHPTISNVLALFAPMRDTLASRVLQAPLLTLVQSLPRVGLLDDIFTEALPVRCIVFPRLEGYVGFKPWNLQLPFSLPFRRTEASIVVVDMKGEHRRRRG